MLWKGALPLLVLVMVTACAKDLLSPVETALAHVVSNGFAMQLSVDPAEIGPGEEFTATYTIQNTRSESVQLKSLCSTLARGVVYRNGQEVGFIGSSSGCRTAIGTHEIAAGETAEWQWQVKAAIVLQAYPDAREPDIALADPGQYVFRVEPDVFRVNGVDLQLPKVEQRIVIQ